MACCKCIKVTPSVTSTQVILTPANPITRSNKESFCFRLASPIPAAGAALPVVFTINGATVDMLNKYGNTPVGADFPTCSCRCIFAYYGVNGGIGHVSLPKFPVTFSCANVTQNI